MDPFVVETINWWKINMIDSKNIEEKNMASILLKNIGIALSNSRDTSTDFHYDSGFVHSYKDKLSPVITFEVHPPRRCFRLIENFEKNHEKMSDSKSIQNHSRKLPRAPGHQITS